MGIAKTVAKKAKGKADERYMNGTPTRLEVANYVNALIEEHYMPHIQGLIQMSSMVLQGILIKKNVCTGDELKEITEEFVEEQKRRTAAMEKIKSGELLKEVMTDEYVETLQAHYKDVSKGVYSIQDSNTQDKIALNIQSAANVLEGLVKGKASISDEARENMLQLLMKDKRDIESGEIKLNKSEDKSRIIGVLWDAIIPFSQTHLVNWKPTSNETDVGVVKSTTDTSVV